MKKFTFAVLGVFAVAISLQAASLTHTLITNLGYRTNLINGPAVITSLNVVNGGTGAGVVGPFIKFFDSGQTNATRGIAQGFSLVDYSNGAYITYSSYSTNIARLVTNFSGLVRTQTYSGRWTYPVTNAATTNNYRTLFATTLPATAGGEVDFECGDGIFVGRGLTVTNGPTGTNIVITITYTPAL